MAQEEKAELLQRIRSMEQQIAVHLLPKDEADARDVILEVRAGAGGDEAALFAMDLFQMYQRFAQKNGWKFDVVDVAETEAGGCKEASGAISGPGVFGRLKFESGVHRVQRVPATESQGRVHTSAARYDRALFPPPCCQLSPPLGSPPHTPRSTTHIT